MSIVYEISVGAALKLVESAEAFGVARESLCSAAGLDPATLEDADNQIPFSYLFKLGECAARLTGDDAFGLHVGERTDARMYGLLGYITINRQTFGEALGRLIRYQRIRTKAVEFSLEVVGADALLAYHYRTAEVAPQVRRQESEEMLSTMVRVGHQLTGVDWAPRAVYFEHDRPADITEHKRIFRAPVHFGSPLTKLVLDASVLTLPLAGADVMLGALLERQAEELLTDSPLHVAFVDLVRQAIKERLHSGEARIGQICRELSVSPRTLQRKLNKEGTSFQRLLEETQYALAETYLRRPGVAIGEVAYLTGFSQPSAFHRAFRRWTGLTPAEFRRAAK